MSNRVVTAVATTKETEPTDLDPLYEVIDPDALDALYGRGGMERAGSPDRVEFTYAGCDVVVAGDGSVTVSTATPDQP